MDLLHEEFWVLFLNRANRVVKKKRISEGGVSGKVADPKIIYKLALEDLASGVIVAHNHPSGNLTASQSDIDLTRKLKEAGKFLGIQLLDHIELDDFPHVLYLDAKAVEPDNLRLQSGAYRISGLKRLEGRHFAESTPLKMTAPLGRVDQGFSMTVTWS